MPKPAEGKLPSGQASVARCELADCQHKLLCLPISPPNAATHETDATGGEIYRPFDRLKRPSSRFQRPFSGLDRPVDLFYRPERELQRPPTCLDRPDDRLKRPFGQIYRLCTRRKRPIDGFYRPFGLKSVSLRESLPSVSSCRTLP